MSEIEQLITAVLAFLDTDAVWGRTIRARAPRRLRIGRSFPSHAGNS